jgi:hypothetical protein
MLFARVVKLVDAGDSKSPAARRAGSIPALGTIKHDGIVRRIPETRDSIYGFAGFFLPVEFRLSPSLPFGAPENLLRCQLEIARCKLP